MYNPVPIVLPAKTAIARYSVMPIIDRGWASVVACNWLSGGWAYLARLALLGCTIVAAGCAVGPNYVQPTVAIPASFKEAAAGWKPADPADRRDRGAWWEVFDDPQLNALQVQLDSANQTVASYAAVYQQARALTAEARAAYFPTLSASAGATRSGSGSRNNSALSGLSTRSGTSVVNNDFSLSLDASWEPDLWGSVSRQVASQKAGQQGAAADLANARLAAHGTLAQNYFQLRALDAQQAVLDNTVEVLSRSLNLTRNQYAQGVAARSDVILAQTQLQSAQAAAVDNGVARAQYEHAIAVLVGQPASTFTLDAAPLTATPPQIPAALPSSLLERRPDIASAERKAAAANEQIGVEMAAFFPNLSLSASGGFTSTVFSQLLTAPARSWTLGPQLAATLFDGGLRSARTAAARATFEQDVATYRATVLAAFQDVEDNLAALRILAQEVTIQQQAVESAAQSLDIVTNEYKAGTQAYLAVIVAQTTWFAAQQKQVTLNGERMVAAVGLIKALGGGWDSQQMNLETAAVETKPPSPAATASARATATTPEAAGPTQAPGASTVNAL